MTTVNVTIKTDAGDVDVRAVLTGDRISISQCDNGSWHHAGDGRVVDGRIADCAAHFGLLDCDVTDEVYEALDDAIEDAASDAESLDALAQVAPVLSEQALTSLPTFGGEAPASTHGVFSWDASRLLVQDRTGWRIVARSERQ